MSRAIEFGSSSNDGTRLVIQEEEWVALVEEDEAVGGLESGKEFVEELRIEVEVFELLEDLDTDIEWVHI
jgi:hypothetical protein